MRYPTDADLASHGVQGARPGGPQARGAGRGAEAAGAGSLAAMGRKLRAVTRTIRRRSGEAKAEVLRVDRADGRAAGALDQGGPAARGDRAPAGAWAWRESEAQGGRELEEFADRCEKVASQIKQRVAGRADQRPARVAGRSGRAADPQGQARQTERVRVRQPARRGDREHPAWRARADPAGRDALGNPGEDTLLPETVAELKRLGISPREVALDGGFNSARPARRSKTSAPERVFISGRQQPGSKRTQRRMQRYRTGAEGRISHLKRRYGLDRSRLKGDEGQQIWTGVGDPRLQR